MKIELRGTLRAALGAGAMDLDVPREGLPLSQVLARLTEQSPRAARVIRAPGSGRVLRAVHNDVMVERMENPLIQEGDRLLLLVATAGG